MIAFFIKTAFLTLTVLILIAAVADLGAPHPKLKLRNLRHTRLCATLVAEVENPILLRSITYISAPFTHSFPRQNKLAPLGFRHKAKTALCSLVLPFKLEALWLRVCFFMGDTDFLLMKS